MKSRATSQTALAVSFVLHLVVCVVGLFFWPYHRPSGEQQAIEGVLMQVEETKVKRINRPKRTQIQHEVAPTTQANQPSMKILTSNAPATSRGIVSAAQAMPFQATGKLNLGDGLDLPRDTVASSQPAQLERVITRPVKPAPTTPERPKSRLVQFIERQPGPQRIVYCIDLSSSMRSLPALRLRKMLAIIQDSLDFLEPHDTFNFLVFAEEIRLYQSDLQAVDAANIADGSAYLKRLEPTESKLATDKDMLEALQEARKQGPTVVALFSDGILTSGVPDLQRIRQEAAGDGKIFTMATNMAVNFPGAVLLRMLAEGSEGEFWLVD